MSDASKSFAKYCVKGLKANKEKIKEYLDNSLNASNSISSKNWL